MTIPVGGTSSTPTGTTTPSGTGSGSFLDPSTFLQLLITELKNQDPTQPMDGKDMIAQLATLNQVQYAQQQAQAQQETYASSLIGKSVTGLENSKAVSGTVSGYSIANGIITLAVNGNPMNVTTVTSVGDTSPASTTTTPPPATTNGGNQP